MAEQPNEILDKLKKNAGIIRGDEKKPEKKESTLEEVIATVRDLEARELLEAKARQMRAEFDARTRELEARAREGGKVNNKEAGSRETERWSVVGGKPVKDPDGEYESFAQAYKVASLEAQATSVSAAEKNNPFAFFEFLQKQGLLGAKTDSFAEDLGKRYLDNIDNQLRIAAESKGKTPTEVEVFRDELTSLKEEAKKNSDPIEMARRVKGFFDALREAGVISEPAATVAPIEHLKEKHHHEERMLELKTEQEYKKVVGQTFAELPERIGKGIASQIEGGEEEEVEVEKKGRKGTFQSIQCECGHKIVVPPEAGETITCGHCGAIYARKKAKQPRSANREESTETK